MRTFALLSLFFAACTGATSDHAAAPPGDSGGGGVSFGGAQDIGELRSILDRGEIPGPDTFDANGFFNEHYNAPAPARCGGLLCIASGLSVGKDWIDGTHQATLQIAVTSTADPSTFERLPMNLVVVVDHSGSMASDGRLTKVKGGLHVLIDNLRDEDRLALVEFDDVVDVRATFGTALDRPALHAIVDRLQPRGATNIFGGLEQGFLLLGDVPASERQNRVIFLSDGLATAGDTSREHILQMARERVQRGIGLTTIGVGADFDVGLMRGLAEQGAGNFYFVEDPSAATEVFTEELDYFLQPIALDVQLDATAGPGYRFGEVTGTRLWAPAPSRGAMKIPAVFVASRTSQGGEQGRRGGGSMIFVDLAPIDGNTGRVASVSLSYRTPGSQERIAQSAVLDYASDPRETPAQPYLSAPEMAERYAMYNMYQGIRRATMQSNLSCQLDVLLRTQESAKAWNRSHEDPDLAADIVLVDQYMANLREHGAQADAPWCTVDPIPDDAYGDDTYHRYLCSSGTASGGLPIALGALVVALRRRRQRA